MAVRCACRVVHTGYRYNWVGSYVVPTDNAMGLVKWKPEIIDDEQLRSSI